MGMGMDERKGGGLYISQEGGRLDILSRSHESFMCVTSVSRLGSDAKWTN